MPFDELHVLNGQKVIPIDRYFKEIGLPKDQERERIDLAKDLEKVMLFIFAFISSGGVNPAGVLAEKYIETVSKYMEVDTNLEIYIRWMSERLVDSDEFTDDRATFIGENESMTVFNYREFADALDEGKGYKVWNTMRDLKVRDTHRIAEGQTVPIEEPFVVGDYLMMYPRDYSLGAGAEEIVNCRCWASYV